MNSLTQWGSGSSADLTAEEIRAVAELLGWQVVSIGLAPGDGKAEFLDACAAAFPLPSYFGRNWDALDECLQCLEVDADGLLVLWSGWDFLEESSPDDFATALDIFRTALRSWADEGLSGRVLLLGGGAVELTDPDEEAEGDFA